MNRRYDPTCARVVCALFSEGARGLVGRRQGLGVPRRTASRRERVCPLRRSPPRLGDPWHRSAGPIADGAVQSAELRDARGGRWLCGVGANNGLRAPGEAWRAGM